MATPTVQALPDILASLEPAFAQTRNLYNTQKAGVAGQTQSSKMALDAKKVKGFNNINDQAAARGVSFGGIPLNEQAEYLSTEYLPGMQRIDEQATQRTDALSLALAQLEQDKYKTGLSTQQRQQDTLNTYLEQERARQAQLFLQQQRMEFERSENQANRNFTASQSKISPAELRSTAYSFLQAGMGGDNKVSPDRYKQARAMWIDSGGDAAVFDRDFRNFVNESHAQDYGVGPSLTKNYKSLPGLRF